MSNQKDKEKNDAILKELGVGPSEFDGVSTTDLTAEQKRLDVALKQLELQDRLETMQAKRGKAAVRKAEFEAKNRAIAEEIARRNARMRGCTHRKGGLANSKGLPEQGGDADKYALLKHQLPNGDWWVTCQRCAAEWFPEDRFTGRPATVIGGFTYRDALMAPTDNSPSKSAVFHFEDNRTPEQVEADRYRAPVDENGKPVKDVLALPLNYGGPLEPPAAVRTR